MGQVQPYPLLASTPLSKYALKTKKKKKMVRRKERPKLKSLIRSTARLSNNIQVLFLHDLLSVLVHHSQHFETFHFFISHNPKQMNSISFPFPLFMPFLLLILVNSPIVSANDHEWFLDCQDPAKCETMEIPLKGDNRTTRICGYPEPMKVNCEKSYTTIDILRAKYGVLLGFNMNDPTLIIAEKGISDVLCSQYHNTLSGSIYAMIPEPIYIPLENRALNSDEYCMLNVIVPISPYLLKKFDDDLRRVAQNIKYELNFEQVNAQPRICESCSVPGGVCGYDLELNQPLCYCQSSSNGFEVCPPKRPDKHKKSTIIPLIIGVSIGGACLVAIIFVCCILYCLKRENKDPIVSREGPADPLVSNNDIHPTILLNSFQTQSIPSYPSSQSDLHNTASNHATIQVFNYADLENATANFNRSRELGDGGYGTVYYGMLQDGREVAVKRLYEHNCKRVEQFMNEVDILANLQHKNLVKLYGCTSRFSRGLLLVYEYIPNGTVADHLHGSRAKFGLLSWPIRLRIAIETANALVYLHRSEIIHRDVKTNNILLDNNFTVKVADFGLSRLFPIDVTHVSTAPQGTPGYVDPEYYQCYQLTTKSDVYSFGVVLIELISSLRAVDTDRNRQDINLSNMALSKIQSQALNELIDPKLDFDKNHVVMRAITSVAELAFRCLQQEKDMRPTMEEVVEELRDIENDEFSFELTKVVDIGVVGDDIELTKRMLPSFFPNSAIANN